MIWKCDNCGLTTETTDRGVLHYGLKPEFRNVDGTTTCPVCFGGPWLDQVIEAADESGFVLLMKE